MGQGYTRNDTSNNIADGNVINASDLDGEFNAVDAAFNESSGHTHDGTADEGAPVTVLGPVQDFVASATEIKPKTSNTLDIGTTSLQFKDMYLDGTAYIDGLGEDILVATDKKVQFRDTALFINSSTDGQLDIAADTEVEITTALVEISADATVGDDLTLKSDAAVLGFGADTDVTLTHVADTGLLVNAAMVVQFRDSAINIGSPADGDLDINADDEIELNSTLIDINGNVEISGTLSQTGIATFTDDIIIGDGKTIGSASDVDAITIASNGQLTLTQQLNGAAGTFSGILKTDDATEATSTTDGSLQTDGGLSVVKDAVFGDDIKLLSDSAVIHFGADSDITLTHAADTSLATNGVMIATTFEPTGDTAAGDNAAIGYTAAEGLILTGQGSTSDITLKNDADATVFTVPTGTDDILFPDNAKAMFGAGSDLQIHHDGTDSHIDVTGVLTVDVSGDITLDAGGGEIFFQDDGTSVAYFGNSSTDFLIGVANQDKDLYIQGNDGGSTINALQLDMSAAGFATFNAGASFAGQTTITTADNTSTLTLISTDADANRGPQLDLYRNSSSPADSDTLGYIRFLGENSADEQIIYTDMAAQIIDVTDGTEDGSLITSTMQAGTLTESMRVDHAGGVRINTTAQLFNNIGNEKLTVDGKTTGQAASFSTSTSGGFPAMYVRNTLSGTVNAIIFHQGSPSAAVGSITMSGGSSTGFNTSSDYRLKTAVTYDWDATTRLKQLKPARFKWIVAGDDAVFVDGFLAHEAQAVVPEAVTGTKDEVDDAGNAVMQGIDQAKLVPLLCKTILELEARITALEA